MAFFILKNKSERYQGTKFKRKKKREEIEIKKFKKNI